MIFTLEQTNQETNILTAIRRLLTHNCFLRWFSALQKSPYMVSSRPGTENYYIVYYNTFASRLAQLVNAYRAVLKTEIYY